MLASVGLLATRSGRRWEAHDAREATSDEFSQWTVPHRGKLNWLSNLNRGQDTRANRTRH